ncbi:MAG: MerR family transcriptional regulator [Chloroflexota bacterium]
MENLISIGQFAEKTQLSLKALRLYHDKGLLPPAYIDPSSSYRYYEPAQVQTAQYIRMLREMDMPLTMIEQFLELFETEPIEATAVLQKYLQLFEARVVQIRQAAMQVSQLLEEQQVDNAKSQEENQRLVSGRSETELGLTEREVCLYDLPFAERHRLLDVLKKVLNVIEDLLSPDDYRLVGTTASVLHGAKTPSKGIDILVRNRENVEAFHLAMSPFKLDLPPTYDPEDALYWASYFVDGTHVDVATNESSYKSDGIESAGSGPWTHFSKLPWGHHSVPTVNLELRLVTELYRNRPDRYIPLIDHMRGKKIDIHLLHRGMDERQIPQVWQEEVIQQLAQKKRRS